MSSVKWIKINIDMFDDEKIKIIQAMPEGDSLLVVWIKLITLAGKTNDGGYIYIAENMPYTEEMLATIMNKPINTIRLALSTFLSLKMIEEDTKGIYLVNFEKHQSLDKMEKLKEQNRIRVAKYRDKKKQELLECNNDVTLHVMQSNGIDIDIDKDIDKEEIRIDYGSIVQMYNANCPSLPSVKSVSASRKKAIKARMNTYSVDDLEVLFQKAEASDFLKGKNNRNWTANFDWLIKDANMAKVLDGNYDNKQDAKNNAQPEDDDLAGIF